MAPSPAPSRWSARREGGAATVASSSEEGRRLDETQYAFDDGPCLTAARQQRLVLIADLKSDERWSDYLEAALQEGVRSVLAVPIPTDPFSHAGLNCYATTVGAFNAETVGLLEEHAAAMSRVLRIALRLHGTDVHPEHLRAALKSRAVVDAAVSLIMAQQRGGRDDALAILQLAAKSTNRRMNDIATDIVRGAGLPQIQRDGE